MVFLCSPCNPTGELLDGDAVLGLARALSDQALVVVDEAYIEYADAPSLARSVESTANLVVLRTLSKAHALAGVRVGCAIADPRIVAALARCQAPYPLPIDSTRAALDALQPAALRASRDGIVAVLRERDRVLTALAASPRVRAVHPSHANFLLVRFHDAQSAWTRLLDAGVVVRDMRGDPRLPDALRVTIGSAGDNARMLEALS